jgi:sulfur oxidation c-type cytochrome SoxX
MELVENGEVFVAYGQNGEMLRPENGYPLRLVVPGVQGVSWVKYLRRIEVGDKPYGTKDEAVHYIDLMPDGQHRQYSSIQECKSVITTPSGGQVLLDKGFYSISGLAWSGRGKVQRVPADGKFIGDWKVGETLAQSGRGMTWTDKSTATSANGGNCYNCHQISKTEISFGTLGPSLYQYGKIRGVANPDAPESRAIVEYTWGKLWNAKAYNACSGMPRFGHGKLLDETQLKNIMALLLDPRSPVNQ